jgi:hypothetical protein
VRTDEKGAFLLPGLDIRDSTRVYVLAQDAKGNRVAARLMIESPLNSDADPIIGTAQSPLDAEMKRYLGEMKKGAAKFPVDATDPEITSENHEMTDESLPFGKPFQSIAIDQKYSQYSNLAQLFRSRLPGTSMENEQLKIRGMNGIPIFIYDGVLLSPLNDLENPAIDKPLFDEIFSTINVADIDRIELIRDVEVQIFGMDCSNGIVAIYGEKPYTKPEIPTVTFINEACLPGYQTPSFFESPNYAQKEDSDLIDNRTTLYWNPNIKTNRKGRAKISFYNSDQARNMQICVEGISHDGVPIFDLYEFGRNYSKSNRSR